MVCACMKTYCPECGPGIGYHQEQLENARKLMAPEFETVYRKAVSETVQCLAEGIFKMDVTLDGMLKDQVEERLWKILEKEK